MMAFLHQARAAAALAPQRAVSAAFARPIRMNPQAVLLRTLSTTISRPHRQMNLVLLRPLSTTTARMAFGRGMRGDREQRDSEKTSNNPPSKELFIGKIPYQASEEDVRSALEGYGKIDSLRLIMDEDGSSRGFGFVVFNTLESATAAFNAEIKIGNRSIRTDYDGKSLTSAPSTRAPRPPSTTLFVGKLPEVTEDVLRDKFEEFGAIRAIRLGWQDGEFRGFGHVEFEQLDDAVTAYERFSSDPCYILDQPVRLDYAGSSSRPPRDSSSRGPRDWNSRGSRDSDSRGSRDSGSRGPRDSGSRGPRSDFKGGRKPRYGIAE
ncbi:hypothetical protein C8F01DRAFT_1062867 [Mycena amicta]|nr:hypothetical protein C8F01DRAFT_1062867 [Mycena amicta]